MRMISGFGYRNPEGYPDPTAYSAINNVESKTRSLDLFRVFSYSGNV